MVTSFVGSSAHPRHARAIVAHDQADVDLGCRLDTRLEVQRHLAGDRKSGDGQPRSFAGSIAERRESGEGKRLAGRGSLELEAAIEKVRALPLERAKHGVFLNQPRMGRARRIQSERRPLAQRQQPQTMVEVAVGQHGAGDGAPARAQAVPGGAGGRPRPERRGAFDLARDVRRDVEQRQRCSASGRELAARGRP
jgi:hypothetical protein